MSIGVDSTHACAFLLTAYGYVCQCAAVTTDTHTYSGDDLLTSAEVMEMARISKSTLMRAVKAGKLTPSRTPGGHFRFRRGDIETLLRPTGATA